MDIDIKQPCRGVIIVGQHPFILFGKRVEKGLKSPSSHLKYYCDILDFLGQHGFQVIIPETASLRASGFLADGASIAHFFSRTKPYPTSTVDFFGKTIGNEKPGISVVSNPELPEVKELVDRLHKEIAYGNSSDIRHIISNYDEQRRHSHLEAKNIVRKINGAAPVFYLSDNFNNREDMLLSNDALRKVKKLSVLNINGFMHRILKSGVGEKIGFAPDIKLKDLHEVISTEHLPLDTACTKEEYDADSKNKPTPFADAMHGLAETLRNESANKPAPEVPSTAPAVPQRQSDGPSRADLFKKKFASIGGGTYAARCTGHTRNGNGNGKGNGNSPGTGGRE